jgi:hypothetical protein
MRVGRWGMWLGAAVLLAAPLPAVAQTYTGTYQEPAPGVARSGRPLSGIGTQLGLGGGVTNFGSTALRDATDVGGAWNLRLSIGTRSIVGLEGAYVGTAQQMNPVVGLDPDSVLVGNGAEGALRINAPLVIPGGLVEPFVFGGVGWTHFSVVNDSFNTSFIRENDNILTIPFGGGLAASYRGFMADARFTYRLAYDDEMFGSGNDMRNWIVSANIGAEF